MRWFERMSHIATPALRIGSAVAIGATGSAFVGAGRIPCTNTKEWVVHIAKRYKIDGCIFAVAESCKLLYCSTIFCREALEKEGIPTLEINADMVDARDWDDAKIKGKMASFIETIMGRK